MNGQEDGAGSVGVMADGERFFREYIRPYWGLFVVLTLLMLGFSWLFQVEYYKKSVKPAVQRMVREQLLIADPPGSIYEDYLHSWVMKRRFGNNLYYYRHVVSPLQWEQTESFYVTQLIESGWSEDAGKKVLINNIETRVFKKEILELYLQKRSVGDKASCFFYMKIPRYF